MPTTDQGETGETGKIAVEKPDARAVLNGKRSQVDISYQLAPGGPHRSEADREPPGAADRDRAPHLISIEPGFMVTHGNPHGFSQQGSRPPFPASQPGNHLSQVRRVITGEGPFRVGEHPGC